MSVEMTGGVFGAIFAVMFFLMLAGAAYVTFRALKKTAKLGFRLTIVAVILFIAAAGSFSLWYFSSGVTPKLRPPAEKKAPKRAG